MPQSFPWFWDDYLKTLFIGTSISLEHWLIGELRISLLFSVYLNLYFWIKELGICVLLTSTVNLSSISLLIILSKQFLDHLAACETSKIQVVFVGRLKCDMMRRRRLHSCFPIGLLYLIIGEFIEHFLYREVITQLWLDH